MTRERRQIGHIVPLTEPIADPALEALFAEIRPWFAGELLNYHYLVGVDPATLRFQHEMFVHLLTPTAELNCQERVIISLVVSHVHRCPYAEQLLCYLLHRGFPSEPRLSAEAIAALQADPLTAVQDPRLQELCRFADKAARNPRAITFEHCATLTNEGLSTLAILTVVTIVAFYQYITIHMSALGMVPDLDDDRIARLLNQPEAECA